MLYSVINIIALCSNLFGVILIATGMGLYLTSIYHAIKNHEDFIISFMKDRNYPIKLSTPNFLKKNGSSLAWILMLVGIILLVWGTATQLTLYLFQ